MTQPLAQTIADLEELLELAPRPEDEDGRVMVDDDKYERALEAAITILQELLDMGILDGDDDDS